MKKGRKEGSKQGRKVKEEEGRKVKEEEGRVWVTRKEDKESVTRIISYFTATNELKVQKTFEACVR
jgi:hypothetical protein